MGGTVILMSGDCDPRNYENTLFGLFIGKFVKKIIYVYL